MMLTGPELGQAIERARILKGVTKKAMADHFDVRPPSIQDWVKSGTISKAKLPALWAYFADVAGPEHWGMSRTYSVDAPPPKVIASAPAPVEYLAAVHRDQLLRDFLALLQSLPDGRWSSLRAQLDRVAEDHGNHDSALEELRFLIGAQPWDGKTDRRLALDDRRQQPIDPLSKRTAVG